MSFDNFEDPNLSEAIQKQTQEINAKAEVTTEILRKLNIVIDSLPPKSQQILQNAAESQNSLEINQLDPIALSLIHSKQVSQKINEEYEILKMKQKIAEVQMKIDRNNKFLYDLRRDLQGSRDSLMAQSPNPDNVNEQIRHISLKVASYEESYEKAKLKYTKLSVPDAVLPKCLMALVTSLATLRDEAAMLKQKTDDVALAREARETLRSLRRQY